LHLAAFSGDIDTVKIIYSSYPDCIKKESYEGRYLPLFIAAEYGKMEVFEFLYDEHPSAVRYYMSGVSCLR
jgi:hypothetical protein